MTSPLSAIRVWSSAMAIALIAQLAIWASTPAAATELPNNPTTTATATAVNPPATIATQPDSHPTTPPDSHPTTPSDNTLTTDHTAGIGSISCVTAGGFISEAAYGALKCPHDNNQGQCILENGATGAAFSFAGGIAGKAITKVTSKIAETKVVQTLIKATDNTPLSRMLKSLIGVSDQGSGKTGSAATNTGTRLRPGLTQPGVARTLENSLNPDAYIDDVVSHYGINLRGSGQSISVQFNPNLASAGRVRAASPNLIEVGPNAFASSEEMARTIAHELNHARSFLRGGAAPESTAYGAEGYLSEWMAGLR